MTAGFELMADRADIDFTYSLTDRIFRLSLGELADFSGAKYDGDFSLSLEEAESQVSYPSEDASTCRRWSLDAT